MSLGKKLTQTSLPWQASRLYCGASARSFYRSLGELLDRVGFDLHAERVCRPFYAPARGRPSVPPGVYFRMRMVSRIESIPSQRGLAWRCNDSLSVRRFLGVGPMDPTPEHSTLTVIRHRIPPELEAEILQWAEEVMQGAGLTPGRVVRQGLSPDEQDLDHPAAAALLSNPHVRAG